MNQVEFPNLAPSVCFICEQVDAAFYIDTLLNFEAGGPTKLTGRKYVCSNCISTFASFAGWVPPEMKAAYDNEIAGLEMAVSDLQPDAMRWRDLVEQIPIPEVSNAPEPVSKQVRSRKAAGAAN